MRVLITGGSGHVGRHIIPILAERHECIVYDLVPPPLSVKFLRGNILDAAAVHWAMQGVDAVVHLAAFPFPGQISDDELMNINVMGTQRVVEAAALASPRKLIMASSEATFGVIFSDGHIHPEYVPLDENHPTRPRDAYGLSKLLGEEICRRYTRSHGLTTICLRYCWVWAEQHYRQVREFQADPGRYAGPMWCYIDVRDLGRAILAALEADMEGHETFVLSARRNFAGQPTVELMRRYHGDVKVRRPEVYEELPDASALDWSKAQRMLGWQPVHDWEEELRKLEEGAEQQ